MMDDPSNPFKTVQEGAKAVQEVAKFGQQALELIDKAFGPALEESGIYFGDWVRDKRQERFGTIATTAAGILTKRGRLKNAQQLPLGFGVTLMNNASLEDDEYLQGMWAALLANTTDPKSKTQPRKTFVDLLRGVENLDARILSFLSKQGWAMYKIKTVTEELGFTVTKLCQEFGVSENEMKLALVNLSRLGCLISESSTAWDSDELSGIAVEDPKAAFRPSRLGWELLEACDPDKDE